MTTNAAYTRVFLRAQRVIEGKYGVHVRTIPMPKGWGDLNGAEIFINRGISPEERLFNLLHLFGHTVQWAIRPDGYRLGYKLFVKPEPDLIKRLIAYEREAAAYAASLLVDIGERDMLLWLSECSECNARFIEHFYRTGEVCTFESFRTTCTPLLRRLPIPLFTPTRRQRRVNGLVVATTIKDINMTPRTRTYDDYLSGTEKIRASSVELVPYTVFVSGREFIVYLNVFSPKYFHDTELFAEHLPIRSGERLLEIGSGTGVISIMARYRGAGTVLATDINPAAVANTRENVKRHRMEDSIEVRQGDLYDALAVGEKFDTIFWNTPFRFVGDAIPLSDFEKAVIDPCYTSTERFIKEAKSHLNEGGRVLVGFSSTLGRLDLVQRFAFEAGLSLMTIDRFESEEVHPVMFEILEMR